MWQIFLQAKHWQIFFLLFGTYMLSVLATTRLSAKVKPGIEHNPIGLILLMALGIAPYVLSIFGWLWAVGSLLNANLQSDLRSRTGLFRFAIVYAVFGLVFGLPIAWASNEIEQRWLFVPQCIGVICILYTLNFTAKAFATLYRGRRSRLWNHSGYLIELLALPVFVWALQPRINQLCATAQRRLV